MKVGCGHCAKLHGLEKDRSKPPRYSPCRYRVPFDAPRGLPDSLALTYFYSISFFLLMTLFRLKPFTLNIRTDISDPRPPSLVPLLLSPLKRRRSLLHQRRSGGRRLSLLQHKFVLPWDRFVLLSAFASSIIASHVFMPTTSWRIYALQMQHKKANNCLA